jgi:hypothetical protein
VPNEELTDCLGLNTHSAILVLAITIVPSSRIRRTMKASSGGTLSMSAIEPPVVTMSWVSKLSFTSIGTQKRSPRSEPDATAASISSALANALGFGTVIALI